MPTERRVGNLGELLDRSARLRPEHPALEEVSGESITYAALSELADRVKVRLRQAGIGRGDRVGIYARKSIDTVAAILGVLKAGAAYVPVDPTAPARRAAYVLYDCSVRLVVLESHLVPALDEETRLIGGTLPELIELDNPGGGRGLEQAVGSEKADPGVSAEPAGATADDVAYVLYTSGSTGKPKGVTLTHGNANSFVDWCSDVLQPSADDRFSSHAPLHFDLSILDLYVPLKHGCTVVLIDADTGKEPQGLAALIAQRRISVWYSTPSVLSLMVQYGKLHRHSYPSLRTVLFAGEVFPPKHLRRLCELLPGRRFLNLYGPTETNVCTWYEIPAVVPPERVEPYPIGRVCDHLRARVVGSDDRDVAAGTEGELCIAGPAVMSGYWNLPAQTAQAFLVDEAGTRWYRTGDIVTTDAAGDFVFVGRRDRMVKRRGYRIELGEIEAGLYRHPAVREAAVLALKDDDHNVRIKAYLSCHDAQAPTHIELKSFCARVLPLYMVPDDFGFCEQLPKTSTDKVDYQRLAESA